MKNDIEALRDTVASMDLDELRKAYATVNPHGQGHAAPSSPWNE